MRFVFAIFMLCALPAWATTPPQGFTASYDLSLEAMPLGETERKLEKLANGDYLYSTRTTPTGLAAMLMKDRIVEQSRFRFLKGRFQPLEYQYSRTGGKKTRNRSARFDWQAKQARGVRDGEPWQVAIKPGVLDRLLYQLAASYDLQKQRKQFSYQIADRGELKTYELTVAGNETLDTPYGRQPTIKLQRIEGDYETSLWLAKGLSYLPVRIEHTEDGKRYRAELKALSGITLPAVQKKPAR
ncbi:MAG: DUF3108 domain-containing protein [Hydrogenophilaceae bacterium]|nr:DUF3108 domain-containing protein [Hydrogenophilaceae bacterium]